MKYHIVQINEKIQDISNKYNVSVEEIIKLNRHINNLENVVPGMKIRLPILSDEVNEQLKDNFLDIEKFYPKVDDFKEPKIEKKEEYGETEQSEEIGINQAHNVEKAEVPSQQMNPYAYYQKQPYVQTYQGQPYVNPYQQYPQNPQYQQYPQYPVYAQYPQMNYGQYPYPQYPQNQMMPPVREPNDNPIDVKNNSELTIKQYQDLPPVDQTLVSQPAFSDPINRTHHKVEGSHYQPYTNYFQNPLYTPPYPCGKEIDDINTVNFKVDSIKTNPIRENALIEFDEDVKPIKVDLRDFVKKHTKIRKKKDPLDVL